MARHKCMNLWTKIHNENQKEKYWYHQSPSMWLSPLSEGGMIWTEILRLKDCKSSNHCDEDKCKYRRLRNSQYRRFCHFYKSLFEHIECRKENDKEPNPLDAWIFSEEIGDPVRCDNHEDDWDDETNHEIDNISMTCSCNCQDVIQWHHDICDDNHLQCFEKVVCTSSMTFIMMFTGTYFTIKLPDNVEKQERSEKFKPRNLEEKDNTKGECDTENSSSNHSPKYCFTTKLGRELLGCHTDEDSIISTHHDIDENDIEKRKESGTRCESGEIGRKGFEHSECVLGRLISENTNWEDGSSVVGRIFEIVDDKSIVINNTHKYCLSYIFRIFTISKNRFSRESANNMWFKKKKELFGSLFIVLYDDIFAPKSWIFKSFHLDILIHIDISKYRMYSFIRKDNTKHW